METDCIIIGNKKRLLTFYDLGEDEVPTYRIMNTKTHDRFGVQYVRRKHFETGVMWEVFQSARRLSLIIKPN